MNVNSDLWLLSKKILQVVISLRSFSCIQKMRTSKDTTLIQSGSKTI